MGKRTRILFKLILTAVLSLLLVWLIYTDENILQKHLTQPEGELAETEDVLILTQELCQALWDSGQDIIRENDLENFRSQYFGTGKELSQYISYEAYIELLGLLTGSKEQTDSASQTPAEILREKLTYENKYETDFLLLENDWLSAFRQILKFYGLEKTIQIKEVTVLCSNQNLVGTETIGDGCLLDSGGRVYSYISKAFADLKFTTVKAYVRENRLLTLVSLMPDENRLSNVWIMEADGNGLWFFYNGYEIRADHAADPAGALQMREQIGDISFRSGELSNISLKRERIGGKLLGISDAQAEIEGYGSIPLSDSCVGYRLYEELCNVDVSEMAIGYDFTDFVVENGEICAFLITRKESMETIRVAIKSGDFGSLYQDKLVFSSPDDMILSYGTYDDRKQETIAAGEELTIEMGGEYLSGDRLTLSPTVASGRIQVLSGRRSQGIPEYRGKMEIAQTEEGLVLINEVLLEEYLYSVVASEMPAHYPIEALKAQAVCARTYGYRYLEHPGYEAIGAHVDDSVSYQVYNNKDENVNSTKAVKETAGILLLYEDEPVSTYYYSTSCGFGADAGVWGEDRKDEFPYLSSVYIGENGQAQGDEEAGKDTSGEEAAKETVYSPGVLSQEENFRDYISKTDEYAYEKDETWFRWKYQVEELDVSLLSQKLRERYQAGNSKILTFTGEGSPDAADALFEEREPEGFRKVYDIRCLKRKEGGVMDELLIETEEGIYKVISEYNIRYLLNQGNDAVGQKDVPLNSSLLPSAYMIIDTVKSGKNVVGYNIMGGGYGHGVGMSQNGAKAMGLKGMDYETILSFYYQDCQLDKIY